MDGVRVKAWGSPGPSNHTDQDPGRWEGLREGLPRGGGTCQTLGRTDPTSMGGCSPGTPAEGPFLPSTPRSGVGQEAFRSTDLLGLGGAAQVCRT